MSPDPERLLAAPEYHMQSFDGDSALFLPMSRANYHQSAFLDQRAKAHSDARLRLPLAPLVAAARSKEPPRIGWIFHVAHCGSTLLSRLVDSVESSLVLREPPPLRQLGLAVAQGARNAEWQDRLVLAHAMAARRFNPERPTIVKANVPVNFMLDSLHDLDAGAPAVLLYQPFEAYLVSILRSPQHRIWVERITGQMAPILSSRTGLQRISGVAEQAAALWAFQILAFNQLLEANPSARSLEARMLFEHQLETGKSVARHLGAVDADVEGNAASMQGRYAKDMSRAFSDEDRRNRDANDRRRLDDEITTARKWLDGNAVIVGLPERLARPLVGEAPGLIG